MSNVAQTARWRARRFTIASMSEPSRTAELTRLATAIRCQVLTMITNASQGRIGGDYSVTDALTVLFNVVLDVNPAEPRAPKRDIVVLSRGHSVVALYATPAHESLAAATILAEQGIDACVLNVLYISPLDVDAIIAAARETRAIVTVEDATVSGGVGAVVASVVARAPFGARVPVRIAGACRFAPTCSMDFLLDYFGLTSTPLVRLAEKALKNG